MNYHALGEFTAFSQQAKDAAGKRFALLHNLGSDLTKLSKEDGAIDFISLTARLEEVRLVEAEMFAAVERANQAAALAQQTPLSLSRLCNK